MERIEYELAKKELYDYSVVNDNLDVCADEIIKIIKMERSKLNEQ